MQTADSLWADDVDRLIARLEIRLEQYRIHAENLAGREREGADALVNRIERRLEGLQAHREKRAL